MSVKRFYGKEQGGLGFRIVLRSRQATADQQRSSLGWTVQALVQLGFRFVKQKEAEHLLLESCQARRPAKGGRKVRLDS